MQNASNSHTEDTCELMNSTVWNNYANSLYKMSLLIVVKTENEFLTDQDCIKP